VHEANAQGICCLLITPKAIFTPGTVTHQELLQPRRIPPQTHYHSHCLDSSCRRCREAEGAPLNHGKPLAASEPGGASIPQPARAGSPPSAPAVVALGGSHRRVASRKDHPCPVPSLAQHPDTVPAPRVDPGSLLAGAVQGGCRQAVPLFGEPRVPNPLHEERELGPRRCRVPTEDVTVGSWELRVGEPRMLRVGEQLGGCPAPVGGFEELSALLRCCLEEEWV